MENPVVPLDFWPSPLDAAGRRTILATEGSNLGEVLTGTLPAGADALVLLNGDPVDPETWDDIFLRMGDVVQARTVLHGGDGSNPIAAVLSIAVLLTAPSLAALLPGATATAGAGAGVFGGFATGLTTFGNFAAAAIGAVGLVAVNNLFPPRLPKPGPKGAAQDRLYTLTGGRNRQEPFGKMLLVIGQHRVFPDYAAKPYAEFVSPNLVPNTWPENTPWDFGLGSANINYTNVQVSSEGDQYLNELFDFGLGNLRISNERRGETALTSYDDVATQVQKDTITLFAGNVDTIEGGPLDRTATYVITRTTEDDTTKIAVDLVSLHLTVDSDGDFVGQSNQFKIEYRVNGTTDWTSATETVQSPSGAKATRGVRRSFEYGPLTADSYDVRVTLLTSWPEGGDNRRRGEAVLFAVRAYQDNEADFDGRNPYAIRTRASKQISGTPPPFSADVAQLVPVWDGTQWVADQVTSNPAWQFRQLAIGYYDSHGELTAGGGRPASEIDDEAIKAWGAFCDANGLTCNLVLSDDRGVREILDLIAQCGWASYSPATGKIGVIWENANQPLSAVFTPANIVAGSFNAQWNNQNIAEEVIGDFVDEDSGYEPNSLRRTVSGVTNPKRSINVDMEGITDGEQVAKELNRTVSAQKRLRRMVSWEVSASGLLVTRGNVVGLAHGLVGGTLGGRLRSIDAARTGVTLSSEIAALGYIWMWTQDGRVHSTTYTAASYPNRVIALADAIPAVPAGIADEASSYAFMTFRDGAPKTKVRITAIEPAPARKFRITARDEVAAYYADRTSDLTHEIIAQPRTSEITDIVVTDEVVGNNIMLNVTPIGKGAFQGAVITANGETVGVTRRPEETLTFISPVGTGETVTITATPGNEFVTFGTTLIVNHIVVSNTAPIDGAGVEFVFKRTTTETAPAAISTNATQKATDDFVPPDATDDPTGVTSSYKYEWVAKRQGTTGNWGEFSAWALWAKYSVDVAGVDRPAQTVNWTSTDDGNSYSHDEDGNAVTVPTVAPDSPAVEGSPPQFASADVSGSALNVVFTDSLGSAKPGNTDWSVRVNASAVAVTAQAIAGDVVTLTLASAVTAGQSVTVSYTAPESGSALEGADGLDVRTFGPEAVVNALGAVAPPTVLSAWVRGDAMHVIFNRRMDKNSTPSASAWTVTVDGQAVAVSSYVLSQSSAVLTLARQTVAGEVATVAYTKPGSGDVLEDWGGRDVRTFSAMPVTNANRDVQSASAEFLGTDIGPITVEGERDGRNATIRGVRNLADAPKFGAADVNGAALKVTFIHQNLAAAVPPGSAWAVTVAGAAVAVSSQAISGRTVTLTLASAAAQGQTVTVAYTQPGSGPVLKGENGKAVESFAAQGAVNALGSVSAPAFLSGWVNWSGEILTVGFNRRMNASRPAASAWTVTVDGQAVAVSSYEIEGSVAALKLASAVKKGVATTVGYTKPGSGPVLQDFGNRDLATFSGQSVRNLASVEVRILGSGTEHAQVEMTHTESGLTALMDFDVDTRLEVVADPPLQSAEWVSNDGGVSYAGSFRQTLHARFRGTPDAEALGVFLIRGERMGGNVEVLAVTALPENVTLDVAGQNTPNASATLTHVASGISAVMDFAVLTLGGTAKPGIEIEDNTLSVREGGTAIARVRLTAQPSANVTVAAVAQSDRLSITAGALLTFTENNWDRWQEIRVSTTISQSAQDVIEQVSLTASGGAVDTRTFAIAIGDAGRLALDIENRLLQVDEGSTVTLRARLTAQPLSDVTVTLAIKPFDLDGDLTIATPTQTIAVADWDDWVSWVITATTNTSVRDTDFKSLVLEATGGLVETAQIGVGVIDKSPAPTPPPGAAEKITKVAFWVQQDAYAANSDLYYCFAFERPAMGTGTFQRYEVSMDRDIGQRTSRGAVERLVELPAEGDLVRGYVILSISGTDAELASTNLMPAIRTETSAGTSEWSDRVSFNAAVHPLAIHPVDAGVWPTFTAQSIWGMHEAYDREHHTARPLFLFPTAESVNQVPEGGSKEIQVKLAQRPLSDVTVTPRLAGSVFSVDESALTFTNANWETNQSLTVRVPQDADAIGERGMLFLQCTGGFTGAMMVELQASDDESDPSDAAVPDAPALRVSADGSDYDSGSTTVFHLFGFDAPAANKSTLTAYRMRVRRYQVGSNNTGSVNFQAISPLRVFVTAKTGNGIGAVVSGFSGSSVITGVTFSSRGSGFAAGDVITILQLSSSRGVTAAEYTLQANDVVSGAVQNLSGLSLALERRWAVPEKFNAEYWDANASGWDVDILSGSGGNLLMGTQRSAVTVGAGGVITGVTFVGGGIGFAAGDKIRIRLPVKYSPPLISAEYTLQASDVVSGAVQNLSGLSLAASVDWNEWITSRSARTASEAHPFAMRRAEVHSSSNRFRTDVQVQAKNAKGWSAWSNIAWCAIGFTSAARGTNGAASPPS